MTTDSDPDEDTRKPIDSVKIAASLERDEVEAPSSVALREAATETAAQPSLLLDAVSGVEWARGQALAPIVHGADTVRAQLERELAPVSRDLAPPVRRRTFFSRLAARLNRFPRVMLRSLLRRRRASRSHDRA